MKKLIVGALLMIGMTSFAQEGKPMQVRGQKEMTSEEREQNQLKRLTSELNLDAQQQKEMAAILNERSEKREAMMAEHKANKEKGVKPTPEERKERRAEMDAFHADQDAKIKKVLKADQATKWEKMKEQEKQRRKDKMQQKGDKSQKSE
jgi:protein CpxP